MSFVAGLAGLRAAPPTTAPDASALEPITARVLATRPVIGELGLPLGTVTEIHATIFAGSTLRMKAYDGIYLLDVTNIGGRPATGARRFKFSSAPGAERLPRDHFSLYEYKHHIPATQLSSADIAELEKGFVGKQVTLLVYETGGYYGIPQLPRDIPAWADTGFGFSTSLVVLADRSPKP